MFRHYLHTIFRTLARNRFYTLINVLGLSFGLCCFLLITLFVRDELSYEKHYDQHERIFRIAGQLQTDGQGERSSSCPFPVGPTFLSDHPQLVEQMVRFFNFQEPHHALKYEEKVFNETGLYLADSTVFEVFGFPLLHGDPETALDEPRSIVITPALAQKYFGEEDPMGKVLKFDGAQDLKVTGILGAPEGSSHIRFDALVSFSTLRFIMGPHYAKNWVWNPCWTYLLLKDDVTEEEVEAQFPSFVEKYYPDFLKSQVTHHLQPLTDIHLTSHLEFEMAPNGHASTVYIFGWIGIFILLIGCINYMNLATARSAGRARETGIRKVSGAFRSQLVTQHLLEALTVSLMAVLLSLALIEVLLPWFNDLSGKELTFELFSDPLLLLILIGAGIFTGLVSGLYPAFVLSSFLPVSVLKGGKQKQGPSFTLRRVLVVLQFSVSLILIIATMVVYRQLNHLRNVGLGFDEEQVVMIPVRPPMGNFFQQYIDEVNRVRGVLSVATMNDIVGKHHNNHEFNYRGMEAGKWVYFPCLLVNEDFVKTMRMQLVAGRDFSRDFPGDDSLSVIVNEVLVKQLGWTNEEAIGEQFYTPSGKERIIGVVKNFNSISLLDPVKPFVLDMPHPALRKYWTRFIAIRVAGGEFHNVKPKLEEKWKEASQEYPFEYFFLDDELDAQYQGQEKLARLVTVFSLLAVFIACLGLFALASFSAEQRTKEIGVRKVLGATTVNVVMLLSGEFLKLILFSVAVAVPVSWYLLDRWLEGFAYRIDITFNVFVFSAVLLIIIALATVSFKAWRVASMDPGKALRYE